MSTLTLTPTSNSITAEVNSFYQDDRIFEWYLNGALKATTSSALVVNSYTFTPVPFWSPYHVDVQIYNSDHTALIETVSDDTDTTFASLAAWDWNISNGNATAEQTQEAYTAASSKQQTKKFNHAVWNDIIAYIIEARQASGQPLVVNTDMTMQANDPLTANIMNAAVKNVDYPWWTWRDAPDDYDVDGRYISYLGRLAFQRGDVVFGRYIIELVKRLNTMRNIYSGRNISPSAVNKQLELDFDAFLRAPQTTEIFASKNIVLTPQASLLNGTGKLLQASNVLPLLYTVTLDAIARQLPLETQRQIVVNTLAQLRGGTAAHFEAHRNFTLSAIALAASALGVNLHTTRNVTLGNLATAGLAITKQIEAAKAILLTSNATAQLTDSKLLNVANAIGILLSAELELEEPNLFIAAWIGTLLPTTNLALTESVLAQVFHEIELSTTPNLATSNPTPLRINSAAILSAIANFARLGIVGFQSNQPIFLSKIANITTPQSLHMEFGTSNQLSISAQAEKLLVGSLESTIVSNLYSSAAMRSVSKKLLRGSAQAILQSVAALNADSTHGYDISAIQSILFNYSASLLMSDLTASLASSDAIVLATDATARIVEKIIITASQSATLASTASAAIATTIESLNASVSAAEQSSATAASIPSKPMQKATQITLGIDIAANAPHAAPLPIEPIDIQLAIQRILSAPLAAPMFLPTQEIGVSFASTMNVPIAAPMFMPTQEISVALSDILNAPIAASVQNEPLDFALVSAVETTLGETRLLQSETTPATLGLSAFMERGQNKMFNATSGTIISINAQLDTTAQVSAESTIDAELSDSAELAIANIIDISAALTAGLATVGEAEADSGGWIYPVQTGNSLYIRQAYHTDDNSGSIYLGYKMPVQTENSLYIRQLYYFYQDGNTIYTSWINPEQDGNALYIRQAWENIT